MFRRRDVDRRNQRPVKLLDALRSEFAEQGETVARGAVECQCVNPHAPWAKAANFIGAAIEQFHRAAPVAPVEMMERDADLQDALVECADRIRFRAPDIFEHFVALEIFSRIEQLDPLQEAVWWRFLAAQRHRQSLQSRYFSREACGLVWRKRDGAGSCRPRSRMKLFVVRTRTTSTSPWCRTCRTSTG